jgi:hypothetical protein
MHQQIGSVYLDPPRPVRTRPTTERRTRAVAAGHLAFVGILGLTVAGLLFGVRTLVSSPDPAGHAVERALDDPASRAEIESHLATAIRDNMIPAEALTAAELYAIDVDPEIAAWTAAVLDDPDFIPAVADLLAEVHGRMFIEAEPGPVDAGSLTSLVVAVGQESAPTLATFLPPDGQVVIIDAADLPDLTEPRSLLDRALLIALAAGAALPLAALVHDRRQQVLTWVGRWLLVVGIFAGVAAVGLPWVAGQTTGWVTAETAVRSWSLALLAPAAIAGTLGMGLVSLTALARRRATRTTTREGAAAWLDVVEPTSMAQASPSLALAHRGLVDGSRQLTNI